MNTVEEPKQEKHPLEMIELVGPFSRGAVGCTGSEFCTFGITETKRRTKRWARELDERIDTPDERTEGERFYEWTRRVDNGRLRSIMQRADAAVSGGVAHGD